MEAMREETKAEEQQIVQERVHSEARLASLAVLQRPIRELLPTLPPAVALGHHAPVRDAIELMRQKQLSCVLVVERGQLPAFSANNPPAHARETGRKSLPGAGLRVGEGVKSAH
jgi:CBS domain-containing protein